MHRTLSIGALALAVAALVMACDEAPMAPSPSVPSTPLAPAADLASLPDVRFSEIHYDNASTDVDERIEISGPAGTDLTGWQIVLYNGNGGAPYSTQTLDGVLPATCGSRGVVVTSYPSNGIQNGSPDGMALVDASGSVVEFLSYEGSFMAAGGPADGLTSTDIGASESGSTPVGGSIQRDAAGTWTATDTNTFGACNDAGEAPPPAEVASIAVSPASAVAAVGGTFGFTAVALDGDGNPIPGAELTWSSSDEAVATVDAGGTASAVVEGSAGIVASAANGASGGASLQVVAATPRISELHYDNEGTDTGEAVEIEGPAGLDASGWQLVLYNGNGGGSYHTETLSGPIPATCDGRGVLASNISGIQNGAPDGVALIDPAGAVAEFLSYEGDFTATDGPAAGMPSTDIGVSESSSTPAGMSLQLGESGWYGPDAASFGACNGSGSAPPSSSPIIIDELMAVPLRAEGGASWGEWFEVHNTGSTAVDLQGWIIASSGQPDHTIASSVVVPAGGYAVLGRGYDPARNGGITLDYNYYDGGSTIWLDQTDDLALRNPSGATAASVHWASASIMILGVTRALKDVTVEDADVDGSGWGYSTVPFGDGDFGTPGEPNGTLVDSPPEIPNFLTFSGRTGSDPALPVGFEDQIFATLHDGTGATIGTTFTWTSETPTIATVDQDGVMHALAAGTAVVRATAADGTTDTYSLATIVATLSPTAQYGDNTEFGTPTDADPSDDFIVRRLEYTTSYNATRGTPNWVSYDLDASQITGLVDRCDCFTFDPELPTSFTHLTTADYTGAGAAAGYGIDRGHLVRSFDRSAGTLDNATTFYLSNIVPQASDLNQGPWAEMENYLGGLAQDGTHEVYVVAGVAGSKGTVKDEGLITIPAQVWKVAVIMPRDEGLEDVTGDADMTILAVVMPNDPGVRDVDWHSYETSVDAVEALSGYDLLDLLPEPVQTIIEAGAMTSPAAGVAVLASAVAAMRADAVLSTGEATSLGAKLDAAAAALSRGRTRPAANQLRAFENEVAAMLRSGRLSADAAGELIRFADALIAMLADA